MGTNCSRSFGGKSKEPAVEQKTEPIVVVETKFEPELPAYYAHTGYQDEQNTSWRTIWQSRCQIKLVFLSLGWYGFQTFAYMVLANYLILITFHDIPEDNPDYPGNISANGTNTFQKNELFDLGFHMTPDWSYRPVWLKVGFVDMMVTLSQFVVPIVIFYKGWTYEFVKYTAMIGMMNIMKGFIAMMTILPPARQGQNCWQLNFTPEKLEEIRDNPFSTWFYQLWGMAHGCNDMLWSGHTSQSCLGLLFIAQTLRKWGVPSVVLFLLFIYFCVYVWAVLVCRMHYTIDVFCAALIATALWTNDALSQLIWTTANKIVCNPPGSSKQSYEQLAPSS